jgi:hypothetical protein
VTTTVIAIIVVVAVLVVAGVVALVLRNRRHNRLRDQFGGEYDRTVDDAGSKRAAARELQERKARHDELEIVPLDPMQAQRFREEWRLVQERFVDTPAESVASAHRLLRDALVARGYPTRDDDDRVAMLSVDHADVLDRYRQGMRTEQAWRDAGKTTTEDLRQAMQHYRAVFERVVGETSDDDAYPAGADGATTQTASGTVEDRPVRRTPVE